MTHKSRKNSCVEVLDGLFCELQASSVTWTYFIAVLRIRIRIHRIHMFLGLLDPDPDPLVRGMDPDPSIIMQKIVRKSLIPTIL